MKFKYFYPSLFLVGSFFLVNLTYAKINVLACEPEWAALAQEIGGERVAITTATTAFQDPHQIEARPSLIAKTRSADLLFCTGSELEIGWLPLLVRQSGNTKIQQGKPGYLMAAELVERLEVPQVLDRSLGDIHAGGNPHVHLDPNRLLIIAQELSLRLSTIDTENSSAYQTQLSDFSNRWKTSVHEWETKAKSLKGKNVVVQHSNLNYLFHWLGIKITQDLEPKPGIPPNSGHLAELLSNITKDKPDFIAIGVYQNDKGARWLANRSKLPLVILPFTVGGNDNATDLFSLFNNSIELLLKADSQ